MRAHSKLVYIFYFLLIVFLSVPRIIDGGWRGIIEPMDMRILENNVIQHEAHLMLRSTHAMLSNDISQEFTLQFSSSEYRALIPIYTQALFTFITNSYFWGGILSEIVWWWLGSVCTFVLSLRMGNNRIVSSMSGLLAASSPLAVAQIGAGHLHAASSLALPIVMLLGWDALHRVGPAAASIIMMSFTFFTASIFYVHHWIVIPWFMVIVVSSNNRARVALRISASIAGFLLINYLFHATMNIVGLRVHTDQFNDPGVLLSAHYLHITNVFISSDHWNLGLAAIILEETSSLLGNITNLGIYYGWPIAVFAVLGALSTDNGLSRVGFCFSGILALMQRSITSQPWVLMRTFPFIYICSALGAHWVSAKIRILLLKVFPKFDSRYLIIIQRSSLGTCIAFCVGFTNQDLWGNNQFVLNWFINGYKYH